MNGGYWGAVGVRGAVRDKIKRQESLEKEKAASKKKIKTQIADKNIKSPSIKVENIMTRITNNSKPKHQSSISNTSMVRKLLIELPFYLVKKSFFMI